MEKIPQIALREALAFNYWTVDKWLHYLIQVDPTNNANEEMQLKVTSRYKELMAHWHDTEHLVKPRDKTHAPNDAGGEYPIRYLLAWTHSRNIEIYWLDWAVSKQLIPIPTEAEQPIYSVDWTKWAKIKKIELGDACGLLAGIDVPDFKFMQSEHRESMRQYSEDELDMRLELASDYRNTLNAAAARIILKTQIENVARNHLTSGCFIGYELVEVPLEFAREHAPNGQLPEGTKSVHTVHVDLPAFGTWAASVGYELPPEFPITSEINNAKSNIASKGGKARAEIYSGAREVCRSIAMSLRAGKERGDRPSLDDCANLIDGERDLIEADNNVTLPVTGTIRKYLQSKDGEAVLM